MDSNHILQLMKHVITYHWLPIVVEGSVNALREFNVVTRPDKYYNITALSVLYLIQNFRSFV